MSTTRAYQSSSGDTWDLVRDDATAEMRVRHTPNLPSGGRSSEIGLAEFIRLEPHSPQHQAIAALVGRKAEKTPTVRGYVHDPKEEGGPYIAVVLRQESEPVVTLHKSYAEAERELAIRLADVKQTTL